MPDPGMMDTEVKLLETVRTKSATGAGQVSYPSVGTVWAKVGYVGVREMFKAGAEISETLVLFTIYYRSDIGYKHAIEHRGEVYQIIGVKVIGRDEYLELTGRLAK